MLLIAVANEMERRKKEDDGYKKASVAPQVQALTFLASSCQWKSGSSPSNLFPKCKSWAPFLTRDFSGPTCNQYTCHSLRCTNTIRNSSQLPNVGSSLHPWLMAFYFDSFTFVLILKRENDKTDLRRNNGALGIGGRSHDCFTAAASIQRRRWQRNRWRSDYRQV